MSIQAILLPMFVQVGLTFVLLFWMAALRHRALRSGEVDPHKVRLREPNWPPRVTQIANAFHNQLELPTLFYVVVLLALITETLDVVVDPPLLTGPIRPGNIVSGWFWLSGRVRRDAPPRAGWFSRLTGRG